MQNKNFDGIQKKQFFYTPKKIKFTTPGPEKQAFKGIFYSYKLSAKFSSLMLVAAVFVGSTLLVFAANSSVAQTFTKGEVLGAQSAPAVGPFLPSGPVDLRLLGNTSIRLLNDYLEGPATEEQIVERKEKLQKYLEYRSSPFAKDNAALDTLVRASHMKIILEVANAESSLGKKCADNNCSNIGSAPDRPYWHEYKSLSNWVLDFNRLLDRRYKDWTLNEMCGVYVKPCTESWLAATGEVRIELAEWGVD